MFKKILIANRGEIAIRVIRTCQEMGIKTVAVYSEADKYARHSTMADEAYCLGAAPSADSYLKGDDIIALCKKIRVDAVHPGYGFLSENAEFTRNLAKNNIAFIGPSPESMDLMGDKISSKQTVVKFGVPLVPGLDTAITDVQKAKKYAQKIGFPVLVKASAGGGGKGMRVVDREEDFETMLEMAKSEAISSFGNDAVFIEKYVLNPRHIEIQILADNHGNTLYLFERECSVQRRHQKLVEEAPSGCLSPAQRQKMGEAAVNVAKSCNYSGAGTVEFLLDASGDFYFLEMNTRLQVEHPVTEMITGLDLVREQINVAANKVLTFKQEDLEINGHAIELRICAEDPNNNFLPELGTLETYNRPQGAGIRVDDFVYEGYEIPIYYDNMIAKLIVHDDSRELAIEKMKRAISEFNISGFKTTLEFGNFVMNHPAFISAKFDTGFVAEHFTSTLTPTSEKDNIASALFAALIAEKSVEIKDENSNNAVGSKWLNRRG